MNLQSFKFEAGAYLNDLCGRQVKYFEENLAEGSRWARKMRDSWGNFPPSGLFSGNLYDFGSFDQCVSFSHKSSEVGDIRGQYCLMMSPLNLDNGTVTPKIMPPSRDPKISVGTGVCLPDSCTAEQIQEFFASSTIPSCSTGRQPFEFTELQIFAIVFFVGTFLLVVMSTIYDVMKREKTSRAHKILTSFSCKQNSVTIMALQPASKREMTFLHGIRSFSMIWIVICHTYMITYWLVPAINSHDLIDWIGNFSSMFLFSGFLGVDTFFMLSSFLMTMSVFREIEKTNKINVPILLVKRFFRIAVPYAAAILFTLTIFYHISDGPLWKTISKGAAIGFCEDWWWTSLLFVGNYVNPGRLCFGHSWYLMADMQLYFLSPIVLYPLWRLRNRVKTVVTIVFVIASSSVIFVFIAYLTNNFRVSFLSELNFLKEMQVYTVTHARIDSWMMGILLGYIFHKIQGKTVILSKFQVFLGWFLSLSMLLTVILAQYPLQQENFKENPIIADAFYDSFKRIAWCVSIGWIIFACHFSYGGVINKFLSLPIWLPISKLSFCMYLMHLPVQVVYLASIRSPQYFSNLHATHKFFGDFGISFFVAFVWALMFEFPTLNIISALLQKEG